MAKSIAREKNKKVIMAMSGGVDSSVAAALLKKDGYDVVGAFMKFWRPVMKGNKKKDSKGFENRCCSSESEKMARAVAKKLDIPFYVFNFEREFKKKVVDYFLKEEKAGLTPNPCVVCNKEIKFGFLLEKAFKLNVDFIATGHYSRIFREVPNPLDAKRTPRRVAPQVLNFKYKLLRARDKNKDQSYFLWQLNQKQLKHILFPVGDYKKAEIKRLAKKFKLPVLNVSESQEICFIETTVAGFLSKYFKKKSGKIISKSGEIIGEHQGLWSYTIGQRKGIKLSGGPYWVLGKDIKRNILIVTRNKKDLYKKELIAKSINWVLAKGPRLPLRVKVQIRYRHKPASALIKRQGKNRIKVVFARRQRAITPGQSVVFYLPGQAGTNQELLGGGIIC